MQDDFEEYFVPHRFEEVCRQYLVRQNRAGKIPEIFSEIGKCWYDDPVTHTNGEFGIVTRDPRGYIFYEAKFRSTPVTTKMMEDEIAQVKASGLSSYAYGYFSRPGFKGVAPDVTRLIPIGDLYR